MAPVNAPRTCPNSSEASNPGVSVAQFSAWKGSPARGLSSCRARATSSLPVPVSPRMSTLESVRATRSRSSKKESICGDTVMMPWNS